MEHHIAQYLSILSRRVEKKIEDLLNDKSVEYISNVSFQSRLKNPKFKAFQRFYFSDTVEFEDDFFNTFRTRYALQGVDSRYLKMLNEHKSTIKELLINDDVVELYFTYFHQQEMSYGRSFRKKNLGSFYTKLCHTFNKEKYTPMDNPMRHHFGLNNESFPISMIVVSNGFKGWCNSNRKLTEQLKLHIADEISTELQIPIAASGITDMKLMDMIYWSVSNWKSS